MIEAGSASKLALQRLHSTSSQRAEVGESVSLLQQSPGIRSIKNLDGIYTIDYGAFFS